MTRKPANSHRTASPDCIGHALVTKVHGIIASWTVCRGQALTEQILALAHPDCLDHALVTGCRSLQDGHGRFLLWNGGIAVQARCIDQQANSR